MTEVLGGNVIGTPAATNWMHPSELSGDYSGTFLALTERHWSLPKTIHMAYRFDEKTLSLCDDGADITAITIAIAKLYGSE